MGTFDDLCGCGCGERAGYIAWTDNRTGVVEGTPRKFIRGHVSRRGPVDYCVDEQTGCWAWQRGKNKKGYGSKYDPRTRASRMAHRVYYENATGVALEPETHLHHRCGNPSCVNPAHLEPVTNSEHGGGLEIRVIQRLLAAGVSASVIADAFGFTVERVERIGHA